MIPDKPQKSGPDPVRQAARQPMFHRNFRADSINVRAVLADIRKRFADDVNADTMGRLELVLAEVMNNVAEHGNGLGTAEPEPAADTDALPSIHLCIVRHDSGLSCAVTDDGVSLPAACLMPRSLPDGVGDALPEGGFGWYLIQDLTQALCYYREERRNFLAFSIPFSHEIA